MRTLHIRLLGDFSMTYGQDPVLGIDTPRPQSVLAYLLLHRDAPQQRRHVAFALWPTSTEAQAQTNLRKHLHYLRRDLPDAERFLHIDGKTVQWRPDGPLTSTSPSSNDRSTPPRSSTRRWVEAVGPAKHLGWCEPLSCTGATCCPVATTTGFSCLADDSPGCTYGP